MSSEGILRDGIDTPVQVGIGGWIFEPWRNNFYPMGMPQRRELEYASRRLTSIEINATYYGSQKPASFARWRDEVPPGFVFSLKGPRYATNKRVLAESGAAVKRFFDSGVMELKEKLGPINWQFLPTRKFDPADFEAFLSLLPREVDGRSIRHAVEVRHASFEGPSFIELLRAYGIALVFTDRDGVPNMHDLTAPFVYVRLQRSSEDQKTGYAPQAIATWAERAHTWAAGNAPEGLARIIESRSGSDTHTSREVFIYMINGFKPRAPAAAMALIDRLYPGRRE